MLFVLGVIMLRLSIQLFRLGSIRCTESLPSNIVWSTDIKAMGALILGGTTSSLEDRVISESVRQLLPEFRADKTFISDVG